MRVTQKQFFQAAREIGRVSYKYPATFITDHYFTKTRERAISLFMLRLSKVMTREEMNRLWREVYVTRLRMFDEQPRYAYSRLLAERQRDPV